jgi:predicted nuclease with TOPRIM domain
MSKEPENIVAYMPKSMRALHEGILTEIARVPGPSAFPDISAHLRRIRRASELLHLSAARIQELEKLLYEAQTQEEQTRAELDASNERYAELEQRLNAYNDQTSRLAALATTADNRARQSEKALSAANARLQELTSAVEAAFNHISDAETFAETTEPIALQQR